MLGQNLIFPSQMGATEGQYAQNFQRQMAGEHAMVQNHLAQQTLANKIAATNAQNQALTNTAIPNAQANLLQAQRLPALTAAKTGALTEKTSLMPETLKVSQANALLKAAAIGQSHSRFSNPLYLTARWLMSQPMAVRAAYIKKNPGVFTSVTDKSLNDIINQKSAPTSPSVLTALSLLPQGTQQQQPTPQNGQPTPPNGQPLQSLVQPNQSLWQPIPQIGDNSQPQNTAGGFAPIQSLSPNQSASNNLKVLTPSTIPAVRSAASNTLIKATIPNAIQTQRYYSAIAGNIYNKLSPYISSVSKYSGISGTFNQLLQRTKSASGTEGGKDYTNLLKFKQLVIGLSNEVRRQLGGQPTDHEGILMTKLTDPSLLTKTPGQILALWKNLGDFINMTGESLRLDPTQIQANLGHEANVGTQSSSIRMTRNGRNYDIPANKVKEAISAGFTR